MTDTNPYDLISHLLFEESAKNQFFQEILESLPRDEAESLVIQIVPRITKKLFSQNISNYSLIFGSSNKYYSSPDELLEVFTKIFEYEARAKASSLLIPLIHLFVRKGIYVKAEIFEEVEKMQLRWLTKRGLGKHHETILYLVHQKKLVRIDTEKAKLTPEKINSLRKKLNTIYPNISKLSSDFFAVHEIFLDKNKTKSLLLPNLEELLTDVDKEEIRKALLSSPDGPKAFAKKLDTLLSFHVPLLSDLKKEEQHLYPHVLQGSVFDFIAALNSVVRWSRQPEEIIDNKTGKKKIVLTFQGSRDPKSIETDLDHTISMLEMARRIFTSQKYPNLKKELSEKRVMNGIFVHDGGEPFSPFGDVTHADEQRWQALKESRDKAESEAYISWWEKRTVLKAVKEEVLEDLYGSFSSEKETNTKETGFIKFLDHFQSVVYGMENIYPYEETYRDTSSFNQYIDSHIYPELRVLMKTISSKAKEELRQFFMIELPLSLVKSSYSDAVSQGRLDKSLAEKLVKATLEKLSFLYAVKSI